MAKTWDAARLEWVIESIHWEEEPDTCLCGQFPINELCYLRNTKNGNGALVGNVCVKKFLGLPSDKIFGALKRVAKDGERALNPEAIAHAFEKKWINKWEYDFSLNTWRKRSLSGKQLLKRQQINQKVLSKIKNSKAQ